MGDRRADAVIELSDPGSTAQYELDYESVHGVNPKIMGGSVTGFRPNRALCARAVARREHGMPVRSPQREVQENRREGRALHG
jgi:crotonobetainyl-CoA:carnitine CoA-transferase CaiB-like acyl-CoA transferase